MSQVRLMKDKLAHAEIAQISQVLSKLIDSFDTVKFSKHCEAGLESRELKQRVSYLVDVLAEYLPNNFQDTAKLFLALKVHWNGQPSTQSWSSFAAWPIIDYIGHYGRDEPALALTLLAELTSLFTAEFALRYYVEHHYELTLSQCLVWTQHDDEHIRRLASEALRPKLPWAKQIDLLIKRPADIFTVLDQLKDDTSIYVRKSVANNLNDISKYYPDQVVAHCKQWQPGASNYCLWIIRRALRTLVKQGHVEALVLLGYSIKPDIKVSALKGNRSDLRLGDGLKLNVTIASLKTLPQKLMVDYKVHHMKANGVTTHKVFKWKDMVLDSHAVVELSKLHPFKVITTRQYYSGQHTIELVINGQCYSKHNFNLVV